MPSIKKDQTNSISFSQNPQIQTEPQIQIHCNTTIQHNKSITEQGDQRCYVYFNTRSAMVSWLLRHFTVAAVGQICGHRLGTMVVLWYLMVGLWWIWVWRCYVSTPIFKNLKFSELTPRLFHHRTKQKHLEEYHQKKTQPRHKSIRSN